MIIRAEKSSDLAAIYELVKTAFLTAKVSNGKEQDFVNQLRAGGNYLPELALVAEEEGKLVGHIMLTKMAVATDSGALEGLLLAPISVVLERRDQGIGAALIRESLRLAKKMGFKAVFLVGDPEYYKRFGFWQADSFGIAHLPQNIPAPNVMAHELVEGALRNVSEPLDFTWEQ